MFNENYLGQVLDRRYRIVETIGVGGIAHVFRAEHVGTGRPLAVKILKSEFSTNIEFIRRFQREAWLTTRLAHDNVVEVLDVQTEGACYMVMELLGGSDLRTYLRRSGPLPWAQVRTIMLQICSAVQYAHDLGVVHRDLKPANCFRIEPSGRIKVLDFGIARPLSPQGHDGKITMTGALVGTPEYMAPEQFLGEFDARSDIYSAGVVMFELLAGRRPFWSRGPELMQQVMKSPPPALAQVRADLDCPPGVDAVVSRVLAKNPGARYASMRDLAQAIAECDATHSDDCDTSAVTLPFSPPKPPRRTLVGMPLRTERAPTPALPPPPVVAPRRAESVALPTRPAPERPPAPEPERVEPAERREDAPARSPAEDHATATAPGSAVTSAESDGLVTPSGAAPPASVSTPSGPAPTERASTPSGPAPTLQMVSRRPGRTIAAVLVSAGALAGAAIAAPQLARVLVAPPPDASATTETPQSRPDERLRTLGHRQPPRPPSPTHESTPPALSAESRDVSPDPSSEESQHAAPSEPRPEELPSPVDSPDPPPAVTTVKSVAKPSPAAKARVPRKSAESAIGQLLLKEEVGASVSRMRVTARFSPEGEMVDLNLHDGLPRGVERERVETSLRKLRLAAGTEDLLVDRTYDLPLPE